MKNVMEYELSFIELKTFKRKDGSTGQNIICLNSDGYRFTLECCNKDVFDFSSCVKGNKYIFVCGNPHTKLVQVIGRNGSSFYQNIPTFDIVGINGEVVA